MQGNALKSPKILPNQGGSSQNPPKLHRHFWWVAQNFFKVLKFQKISQKWVLSAKNRAKFTFVDTKKGKIL